MSRGRLKTSQDAVGVLIGEDGVEFASLCVGKYEYTLRVPKPSLEYSVQLERFHDLLGNDRDESARVGQHQHSLTFPEESIRVYRPVTTLC